MKFGLFFEHEVPRPWHEGDEKRKFDEAMEQIELADRLGFDCAWVVEHHFLEEYSHSSAPDLFLAAVSQRTERIRLGHGIVHTIPAINHPARVAERVSTLDVLCGGRVEFGTGEGSAAVELDAFGVDPQAKRAMWEVGFKLDAGSFMATCPFNPNPSTHKSIGPSAARRRRTLSQSASGSAGLLWKPK